MTVNHISNSSDNSSLILIILIGLLIFFLYSKGFKNNNVNNEDKYREKYVNSTYNKDNFALMLAVLEMWAMGIDLLPRDMSTTFESLNGKFKDIKYLS